MANKYPGITPRGKSIQIAFTYNRSRCRETLKIPPTPANLRYANRIRESALRDIQLGTFDYAKHFPNSKASIKYSTRKGLHITIATALKEWLKVAQQKCQGSTMRGYASSVHYYLIPRFGHMPLETLSRQEVEEWLDSLEISNKRKNNTLIPLRQVFDNAFGDGHISDNPLKRVKNRKVHPREPQPFTLSEIHSILEQLQSHERNLIRFAFWTGLRTSELIALKWANIDLETKSAYVHEAVVEGLLKGTKTSASVRTIELTNEAYSALISQKKISSSSPFVFTDPKSNDRWKSDQIIRKRVWIPALERANVKYRNPYQTRHTYASMMLSAGKNPLWVQTQMGHKDWGMLIRVYGRWMKLINNPNNQT